MNFSISDTMTQNAKQLFDELSGKITVYPPQEAKEIAFWLLDHFLHLSKTDVLFSKTIQQNGLDWSSLINRINEHEPIQYILGEMDFYGLRLSVNSDVLIPRPETEELIEKIVKEQKNTEGLLLDIGTGSGCIALALAKSFPERQVLAWDISEKALEVAKKNAIANQINNAHFEAKNILEDTEINTSFSLIVSNPPYILPSESAEMRTNVLANEPHLALFTPQNDPLLFYCAIARFASKNLTKTGSVWVEINEKFGEETAALFQEHGFEFAEILHDFRGKQRFVHAYRLKNQDEAQ